MFTSPAMMSDLAGTHRRELHAAAARGHRRRAARHGRARPGRTAASAGSHRPRRAYAPAK